MKQTWMLPALALLLAGPALGEERRINQEVVERHIAARGLEQSAQGKEPLKDQDTRIGALNRYLRRLGGEEIVGKSALPLPKAPPFVPSLPLADPRFAEMLVFTTNGFVSPAPQARDMDRDGKKDLFIGSDPAPLLAELAAHNLEPLQGEKWPVLLATLAGAVPDWDGTPPLAIRILRENVAWAGRDLTNAAAAFTASLSMSQMAGTLTYTIPSAPDDLGEVLRQWNGMVLETLEATNGVMRGKSNVAAAQDASLLQYATNGLPTAFGRLIQRNEELASDAALGNLVSTITNSYRATLGPALLYAHEIATAREKAVAHAGAIAKRLESEALALQKEYSLWAGGGASTNSLATLRTNWAQLQLAVLDAARLRYVAGKGNAELASALGAFYKGLIQNQENFEAHLEAASGLRLEKSVKLWDTAARFHNASLINRLVVAFGGASNQDQETLRQNAADKITETMAKFLNDPKTVWAKIAAVAAFDILCEPGQKPHPIKPVLTQDTVQNWIVGAQNHKGPAPDTRAVIYLHHADLKGKFHLKPDGTSQLFLLAHSVTFNPDTVFEIENGCGVIILCHGLNDPSSSKAKAIPPQFILKGADSYACLYVSRPAQAPEFIRVAGPGEFRYVGGMNHPSIIRGWSDLANGNTNILAMYGEHWLTICDSLLSRLVESGEPGVSDAIKEEALLEVLSLPRPMAPALPQSGNRNPVEETLARIERHKAAFFGDRLVQVRDEPLGRTYPVFIKAPAGGSPQSLIAYLLPDELVLQDSRNGLLGTYQQGAEGRHALTFWFKAEVSEFAKARATQLLREKVPGLEVKPQVPSLHQVELAGQLLSSPDWQLIAKAGFNHQGAPASIAHEAFGITTRELDPLQKAAFMQQWLLGPNNKLPKARLILMRLESGSTIKTDIEFDLPVDLGKRSSNLRCLRLAKPASPGEESIQLMNESSDRVLEVFSILSRESGPASSARLNQVLRPGQSHPLPFTESLRHFIPDARQRFTREGGEIDLMDWFELVPRESNLSYKVDLRGLRVLQIPAESGSTADGAYIDLQQSKIRFEYKDSPGENFRELEQHRYESLAEFNAEKELLAEWNAPYYRIHRIILECRKLGGGGKTPLRLEHVLIGGRLFSPRNEDWHNLLKAPQAGQKT